MKYLVDCICRSLSPMALVAMLVVVGACSSGEQPEPSSPDSRAGELSSADAVDVCGWETLPSPARPAEDPCADGELLLETDFARNSNSESFELESDSRVCVLLEPADDTGNSVFVDRKPVDQDGREPEGGRYTFELEAGSHDLDIRGRAGQADAVQVRASTIRPGQDVVHGENGILELTNVMVDHPMFSPNGDDYHDTALFNADNFPRSLPGEASGRFDFFLDWKWEIVEADSCTSMGTALAGTTQVNSPTNVQTLWDGSDAESAPGVQALGANTTVSGAAPVPDGKYLYRYQADLVRSDGLVIDTVTSRAHGMLVDSTSSRWPSTFESTSASSVGQITNPKLISSCDPATDPLNCQCPPESSLPEGTRCSFEWLSNLVEFDDPSTVPTDSFIETDYDGDEERWKVTVDFRTFNGGGLVPKGDGTWESVGQLQQYVEDLTGVPADPAQERLFNFDYVQLGYSTPVTSSGAGIGYNHFLLDVITDESGNLTIGSTKFRLPAIFAAGGNAIPPQYQIENERDGDECYHNGNTDGNDTVEARSCTQLRTANLDPGNTDLGIYRFETRMFELMVNGQGTRRENVCNFTGCAVRTIQRDALTVQAERSHYTEHGNDINLFDEFEAEYAGVPALIVETDRNVFDDEQKEIFDGVCSQGNLSTYQDIEIPLDSADGALPKVCIVNGIL